MIFDLKQLNKDVIEQSLLPEGEYFVSQMEFSPDVKVLPALGYGLTNKGNWFDVNYWYACPKAKDADDFVRIVREGDFGTPRLEVKSCENPIQGFLQ